MFGREAYGISYLAMVIAVILMVFLISERIRKSPYGRVIKAIREDDLVASTLGKDVLMTRVQVFALGACFMGLAGSLNAHYIQDISPDAYTTSISIFIWMSVIAGGAGNNKNLIIGAGLVMFLLEGTRFLGGIFSFLDAEKSLAIWIIISVMLILVVWFQPEGILPEAKFKGRKVPATQLPRAETT